MADWTKSMEQTFEFFKVDPGTWGDDEEITTVTDCNITWDSSAETLGNCSLKTTQLIDECYIRIYIKTIQNGVTERFPLGTFLFQAPSFSFNGKHREISMDGYTPLIELKEKRPPIGYTLLSMNKQRTMDVAYRLCRDNMRAPVTEVTSAEHTIVNNFTANLDDTWLLFIKDLIANAEYHFSLNEMGWVEFEPKQITAAMKPVYSFDDGNSSILYADIEDERDMYGIPNVYEVIYSNGAETINVTVENNSEDSDISIQKRGRRIVYRDTNPSFSGTPTKAILQQYAWQALKNMSCLEHTITYKHGYVDHVRIGTAVRLDYKAAGIENVTAKVISQSISCEPGCPVEETAVYTTQLWDGTME